ncbi:hypothetical protein, partial [Bacteroides caccae]|uniref:hypothetical protein n=1 Tax=Bacteroides caccae TaxID=47678 RepID=UPI00237B5392
YSLLKTPAFLREKWEFFYTVSKYGSAKGYELNGYMGNDRIFPIEYRDSMKNFELFIKQRHTCYKTNPAYRTEVAISFSQPHFFF